MHTSTEFGSTWTQMYARNLLGPVSHINRRINLLFDVRQLAGSQELHHQTVVIQNAILDFCCLLRCIPVGTKFHESENKITNIVQFHLDRLVETGDCRISEFDVIDRKTVSQAERFNVVANRAFLPLKHPHSDVSNATIVLRRLLKELKSLAHSASDIVSFLLADTPTTSEMLLLSWEGICEIFVDCINYCKLLLSTSDKYQSKISRISDHIEAIGHLPQAQKRTDQQ